MDPAYSEPSGAPPAADDCQQLLDMGDRRMLADAVAQVEDMRPVGKGIEDARGLPVDLRPAGLDQQRIEIALDRQALGQGLCRPERIDRLVEPQRVDPGLAG